VALPARIEHQFPLFKMPISDSYPQSGASCHN
jgi:hypothetical protein